MGLSWKCCPDVSVMPMIIYNRLNNVSIMKTSKEFSKVVEGQTIPWQQEKYTKATEHYTKLLKFTTTNGWGFQKVKVVPYTSDKIWSARLIFLFFASLFEYIHCNKYQHFNQQTQSYEFTSHIASFLSVVLITEMLENCIQISYDQKFQLMLNDHFPVVYGTTLSSSCSTGSAHHVHVKERQGHNMDTTEARKRSYQWHRK